jgi:hypothetical protein
MAHSRASVGLGLGIGIFLLTLATAAIHLYLAFGAIAYMGFNFGIMLFILNGLGYLGLLAPCSCRSRNWHAFGAPRDGSLWPTRR